MRPVLNADSPHSSPLDWLRTSVPGEPGVDYPVFAEVQDTSFSCEGRVIGGYYADPEMDCQGYHVCMQVRCSKIYKEDIRCSKVLGMLHRVFPVCVGLEGSSDVKYIFVRQN